DPRVYNKQWAERLVAWDPDNAVPRLFVADQIYRTAMPVIAGSLYDAPVARLAETTAWGEKMRAAIAAPRYDNYMQRRFELDRGMVGRLQGGRADALVLYSTQLQGIPDPWDVQAYAGLLTRKLGPEAEHAGNSAEARSLYWDLANFGERLEKGAEWEGDQEGAWRMEAAAFKSLVSLAERAGNKEEAAAYDLLRQRAESSDAEARRRWESSFRSQWTGAKRPAQLAWPAAGLVLLAGIACVAWVALLGVRSESRVLSGWRGTVALGLSYSPVVLLAASATMYAAMSPYLRTSEEFATRREVFNALVPFWFGFWEGWDVFGWGPRFYIRQMMVPVLLSVAVLITGIAVLRWVARSRAGHTSQAG
ncbi:MAG TPA: hypothetical protein VKG84_10420, partial [Candidatus Acidoferrales bacterium]|nr:hypothetical protein [Candidatus Acidoferrales bacterium]